MEENNNFCNKKDAELYCDEELFDLETILMHFKDNNFEGLINRKCVECYFPGNNPNNHKLYCPTLFGLETGYRYTYTTPNDIGYQSAISMNALMDPSNDDEQAIDFFRLGNPYHTMFNFTETKSKPICKSSFMFYVDLGVTGCFTTQGINAHDYGTRLNLMLTTRGIPPCILVGQHEHREYDPTKPNAPRCHLQFFVKFPFEANKIRLSKDSFKLCHSYSVWIDQKKVRDYIKAVKYCTKVATRVTTPTDKWFYKYVDEIWENRLQLEKYPPSMFFYELFCGNIRNHDELQETVIRTGNAYIMNNVAINPSRYDHYLTGLHGELKKDGLMYTSIVNIHPMVLNWYNSYVATYKSRTRALVVFGQRATAKTFVLTQLSMLHPDKDCPKTNPSIIYCKGSISDEDFSNRPLARYIVMDDISWWYDEKNFECFKSMLAGQPTKINTKYHNTQTPNLPLIVITNDYKAFMWLANQDAGKSFCRHSADQLAQSCDFLFMQPNETWVPDAMRRTMQEHQTPKYSSDPKTWKDPTSRYKPLI